MRITLAQLNPIIGDVSGNTRRVIEAIDVARRDGADLLLTSELVLLGYPPRDLLLREGVAESCEAAAMEIARSAVGITVVVGHPRRAATGLRPFHNSVSVCRDGVIEAVYDKRLLPGYDVFDEDRYFTPGDSPGIVDVGGRRLGIAICEDLWQARDAGEPCRYPIRPLEDLVAADCDVLLSLNASPFVEGKWAAHVRELTAIATKHAVPLAAVNQVGANDDLIFDGRSLLIGADGHVRGCLPGCAPAVMTFDLDAKTTGRASDLPDADSCRETWDALVLGVRDYCRKTGHEEVVLGLSGGVDSALTAAIAAAAIGPSRVRGLIMPSRYSSSGASRDARDLAGRLGLRPCDEVSIEPAHETLRTLLSAPLGAPPEDITDENIQARLRGTLLMGVSNATGALLLATSNKSELAVGYSTLYGDMCGGLSVIGDVLKTRVYDLARFCNDSHRDLGFDRPPIPEPTLTKPPSAELRPNQTDQDSLPPYEILDEIIERYVEREQAAPRIAAETGIDESLINDLTGKIDRFEFKRHQANVILKVSGRAFGRGRPMPIVMKSSTVLSPEECAAG